MRYEGIETVIFTNHNNISVSIKDRREYPDYEKLIYIVTNEEDRFDELASRYETYGDDGEDQSYKIVENNIVELFEKNFDMSKVKGVVVPV